MPWQDKNSPFEVFCSAINFCLKGGSLLSFVMSLIYFFFWTTNCNSSFLFEHTVRITSVPCSNCSMSRMFAGIERINDLGRLLLSLLIFFSVLRIIIFLILLCTLIIRVQYIVCHKEYIKVTYIHHYHIMINNKKNKKKQ